MNSTYPERHPAVTSIAAAAVAGLALWLSRASFDVAGTIEEPVRIAMLPALSELAGLTMMAILFGAAIAWVVRGPRKSADSAAPFWSPTAADILTPLFALGLLALPYLPWLADWIPALRLLAGPARVLVWAIVLGQVAWILISHISLRDKPKMTLGPFAASVIIAVFSLAVFVWPSWRSPGLQLTSWPPLIIAAAIAALIWVWSFALTQSKAAATFAWAAVCLSAPFVLNSRAMLPAPIVDLFNTIRRLPTASLTTLMSGAPGLLFDQEFGLVVHAPVLGLGFLGLALMARNGTRRGVSVALIAASILLIGLAGSRNPWWNESMLPGRTLLLLLLLMGPPIAWVYESSRGHQLRRAALQLLLLASFGLLLLILVNADQVRLPQDGDGSASMLIWMSPAWQLWDEVPTYIAGVTVPAVMQTALWLAAFAVCGWLCSRLTITRGGSASLVVTTGAVVAVIAVVSTSAALSLDPSRRRFDAEGRVLFPMLETFNTVVRPVAVIYDPLSVVDPAQVPPLFSLSAVPGQRRSRQPLRVVLNARFRLPAGEYELDVKGSEEAGTVPDSSLGLQIGREGRPLETWPMPLTPGNVSQRRFRVPLDAEFVGFRASRPIERTIAQLRLRALTIEEEGRRFASPLVRSSADFGFARVFFHDGDCFPEEEGVWVKGRSRATFTILKPNEAQVSVPLAIHSGGRENAAILETPGWSERIELVPGITSKIAVPSHANERFVSLSVTSIDGFVPAEVETGSKDRRLLGVFISFIPDDSAKTSAGR